MTIVRRATIAVAATALALGACGRFGFDALGGGDAAVASDARAPDAAPDAPTSPAAKLTCDQPTLGSGTVPDANDQLAVAATPSTLVAISTDSSKALRVWTFDIGPDGSAVPTTQGATLDTDTTGTIGVVTTPDGVLVSASYAGGTKLYPLHADGTPRGLPTVTTNVAATGALAASGIDGTLAFVSVGSNAEIDAQLVDSTGASTGAMQLIVAGAIAAGAVSIAPAATGYAATWVDPQSSPNAARVALLGADLSVVAGPVTASTDPFDAEDGVIAWAPVSHRYLAAWHDKDATGADQLNIRLYDETLAPVVGASTTILTTTYGPRLSTDGTGFWLTGRGYSPDTLHLSYIAADGTVTAMTDTATADALAWSTTARNGQPVVAWLTAGQLWVDAPCPP